jgi:hypothetical protein
MVSRDECEKQAETARNFDAVLRARVAQGGLTPRVASYLKPETEEPEPRSNETGEGEHEG